LKFTGNHLRARKRRRIPLIRRVWKQIIKQRGGNLGVKEIVVGMAAQRDASNVWTQVMAKPPRALFFALNSGRARANPQRVEGSAGRQVHIPGTSFGRAGRTTIKTRSICRSPPIRRHSGDRRSGGAAKVARQAG